MQTRLKKKGFTLVELVIVVAVIAVLSAILIPTIGCFVEQAKETNDMATVRLLNAALLEDEASNDKPATMTDALAAMASKGYDIEKLTPRSTGCDILWDSENNRFALYKDGIPMDSSTSATDKVNLWKIVDDTSELASGEYSYYLKGNSISGDIGTIKTGLDVGKNTGITAIRYANTVTAQTVTIRTNSYSTVLNIQGPQDIVKHYGLVKEVNVAEVDTASYHEYGAVLGNITVAKGNIEIENGASVSNVVIDEVGEGEEKVTPESGKVTVVVKQEASVKTVYSAVETVSAETVTSGDGASTVAKIESTDTHVAYIGTQGYDDLPSAISALQDNQTLVLMADVTLESELEITDKNNIVLDLNGKTITSNESTSVSKDGRYALDIKRTSITIKGNGTIKGENLAQLCSVICVNNNSSLNLVNGTILGNKKELSKVYGVYAQTNSIVNLGIKDSDEGPAIDTFYSCLCVNGGEGMPEATFNIYSGTYTACSSKGDNDSNVIQISNSASNAGKYTVNIYGGIFKQIGNPSDGKSNILELRNTGAKAINIYGGIFYCNGDIEEHLWGDNTVVYDPNGVWKKSN